MTRSVLSERDKDRIAEQVLAVVTEVHRRMTTGTTRPPEPDRVSAYCPPECRYDYEGAQ